MQHSLEEVRAEYRRLDRLCGISTEHIALRMSTRAQRRLGCFSYGQNKQPEIMISQRALTHDALFLDTIRHEYAHAAAYIRDGNHPHKHDAYWKAICREVGCNPRATTRPSAQSSAGVPLKAKYMITCRNCGAVSYYLREGKYVALLKSTKRNKLICSRCGSNSLTLTVL